MNMFEFTNKNRKAIACPNVTIGNTAINYIIDFYGKETYLAKAGIPSAGYVWHTPDVWKERWAKKPYHSAIMTEKDMNSYFSDCSKNIL